MARGFLAALIFGAGVLATGALAEPLGSVVAQQPMWSQLSASQRTALTPLSKDWNSFSDERKLKWLGIATRYAAMTPTEQARLQERMREWVALSPSDREKARTIYKKLRTVPASEKKLLEQKWQEYEALPAEEKQRLKAAQKPVGKRGAAASASQSPAGSTLPVVLPRVEAPKPLKLAPIIERKPLAGASSDESR
jgi:hypothetical protein